MNSVGAHDAGPYASAFGVAGADWYEPSAPVSHTVNLPGNPTSVNFQPASMGTGSVDIAFSSAHPDSGVANGYSWAAFGFTHANRYVMQDTTPADGNPDVDPNTGWYIPATPTEYEPDNGQPISGEHAALSAFLFATGDGEYGGWSQNDIVVTLSGLSSIATEYHVTLYASAQNGRVVEGFTPGTITDNASNTDTVSFTLLPDRPSYWSPSEDDPNDPYVSIAGEAESAVTFTGDQLEIRLSGNNEYFTNEGAFFRTLLSGIVIDYEPSSTGLAGDYNGNGTVDAADYVIWRKTMGDAPSYNVWRSHFGDTGSPGLGAGGAVPEPAAWSLVVLLATAALSKRFARTN
ncbi:MAG: hypothetical protein IT425_05200, partial [Pirellulales bacterium]|nr:hypothetical protein [Pirellulales bacterium]